MWCPLTWPQELNSWFVSAPRFPATPLALADALARAEHPLLRFFTAVRQPQKKEAPGHGGYGMSRENSIISNLQERKNLASGVSQVHADSINTGV